MMGMRDDGDGGDDALGKDEGAYAEVHLGVVKLVENGGRGARTRERPKDSDFARKRGKKGKSTARMERTVIRTK